MPPRVAFRLILLLGLWTAVVAAVPVDVTITREPGQTNITATSPVRFRVTCSQPVVNLVASSFVLTNATTAVLGGSGTSYTLSLTGMSATGPVTATLAAGAATTATTIPTAASIAGDSGVRWLAAAPALTVTAETAGTVLIEGGGARRLSFALATGTLLTGNLTVTVAERFSASPQLSIAPTTVTFTPGSETATRSVAVSALRDAVTEGTQYPLIGFTVAAPSDPTLNAMEVPSIAAQVADVDAALTTPRVRRADDQPDATAASTIRFAVVFDRTVAGLSATAGFTVAGSTNAKVTALSGAGTTYAVTCSGMTATGTVTLTVDPGAATDSNGLATAPSVGSDATVAWTAKTPLALSSAGPLVSESGGSAVTYSVSLAARPTADVTITLREGVGLLDEFAPIPPLLTLSPAVLTFTSANWDRPQLVTIAVPTEAPARSTTAWRTVRHLLASTDSAFAGVTAPSLSVVIYPLGGTPPPPVTPTSTGSGTTGGTTTAASSTTGFGGGGSSCGVGGAAAALVISLGLLAWAARRSRP